MRPDMRKLQYVRWCVACTMMLLVITSCGTHKVVEGPAISPSAGTAGNTAPDNNVPPTQQDIKIPEWDKHSSVAAKLDLQINDGKNDISVDGRLQMQRDVVVRVLVTPLGLMEAGRIEFTPDYVLLIDRMHKQYVKERYENVEMLKKNGLTFQSIQQRFWEEYKKNHISLMLGRMSLGIDVKKVNYDAKVDAQTDVSAKYERVSMQDVLSKLSGILN